MLSAAKQNKSNNENVIMQKDHTMPLAFYEVPDDVVAAADVRIQKQVQSVYGEIRRTRKAAALTASKIVLNA